MADLPEWRRRLTEQAPLADHWRRRHHCTDVVLGESSEVDMSCYSVPQEQIAPTTPRKDSMKHTVRAAVATALIVIAMFVGGQSATATQGDDHKVVVCKYVGTPGDGERLQTGNNPIVVAVSSLKDFDGTFPFEFADAQGRSIAIRYAADSHDGDLSECPGYEQPSPTPSQSPEPSSTPTPSPSSTPSAEPTPSGTPSPTVTPTPDRPTLTAPPTDTEDQQVDDNDSGPSWLTVLFFVVAALMTVNGGASSASWRRK